MIVQRELGLRPGEVTSLYPDDVSLPEHLATGDGACRAIISLGTPKGAKAKMIQSVVCRNPVILGVLRWLCKSCKPNTTLMGCSYDTYRKLIRSAQVQARLEAGYTPHSPRTGFAMESIAESMGGFPFRECGLGVSSR